jgi:hypothetical protein
MGFSSFQRGDDLLVDEGVGLAEIRAALAVAEDDVGGVEGAQHLGGDLAGVGAALLGVHVLAAELYGLALEHVRHGRQRGERRAKHDVHRSLAPDLVNDVLGERDGLGGRLVHLPVTSDDFLSEHGEESSEQRVAGSE